jgi:hypothetical protein
VLLDGTTTSGIYGKEKAMVSLFDGRMAKLSGLILGCSTFEAGGSVDSNDGMLALGNIDISFGLDGGEWRRRWCGERRQPERRQMEAAMVRTEADGGGDPNGGGDPDGCANGDRGGDPNRGANGGGDGNGGGDPDGGDNLDGGASVEGGC